MAWRGKRRDLEKQFGFDVRNHNFPAGAESIILSNQRQKYFAKGIRTNALYIERMRRSEW